MKQVRELLDIIKSGQLKRKKSVRFHLRKIKRGHKNVGLEQKFGLNESMYYASCLPKGGHETDLISHLQPVFPPANKTSSLDTNLNLVKSTSQKDSTGRRALEVLSILYREGLIQYYKITGNDVIIYLAYAGPEKKPLVSSIKYISKPSRRFYKSVSDLKFESRWREIRIVTTSRGILTDKEAVNRNVGGQLLCIIR